jgi:hypothetical protein
MDFVNYGADVVTHTELMGCGFNVSNPTAMLYSYSKSFDADGAPGDDILSTFFPNPAKFKYFQISRVGCSGGFASHYEFPLQPFLLAYMWNQLCPIDDTTSEACPPWIVGQWKVSYLGKERIFRIDADGMRHFIDKDGNIQESQKLYCDSAVNDAITIRTIKTFPLIDFADQTRAYLTKTEKGFTELFNPTGSCKYPTAADTNGVAKAGETPLTYWEATPYNPPNLGLILGLVFGLLGAVIAVVIAFFVVRTQRRKRVKHGSITANSTNFGGGSNASFHNYPSNVPLNKTNTGSFHGSTAQFGNERGWEIDFSELVLEEEIGKGSFGVVWKGQWRNTEVAIKQVKGFLTEKQMIEFQHEAGLLGKLRPHSNVLLFFGVCTTPYPCIVTELLSGGSVHEILKDHDIKFDRKLKIAKDICSGMSHLHSENVIHRDLAARNVLLTDNGTAKIADFGMSRVMETGTEGGNTISAVGPVKWMAPEALNERRYSTQSDVWSFAVTLWEMFSRKEPFANLDATSAAIQIARDGIRLEKPDQCPDEIWLIMCTCWEEIPENRPDFNILFREFESIVSRL